MENCEKIVLNGIESILLKNLDKLISKIDSLSSEQKGYLLEGLNIGNSLGYLTREDFNKYNKIYTSLIEKLK